MDFSNILNIIGLSFDIVGCILLFRYGLPSQMNTPPKLLLNDDISDKEKIENKKIQKRAYFGLSFLIFGFFLQLVNNFL